MVVVGNLLIGVCCCSMVIFSLNLSSVDSDCFLGVVSSEFVIFVVCLLAVFASACRERFVDKRIRFSYNRVLLRAEGKGSREPPTKALNYISAK